MLPIINISDDGKCSLSISNNEISITYYFQNNEDILDLGIALLKNSLVSKIKVENNLKLENDKLITTITQNLKKELTFYTKEDNNYCDPLISEDDTTDGSSS